jgi:hypothetical protein
MSETSSLVRAVQERADGFIAIVIAFTAAATVGLFVVTASTRAQGGDAVFTAYLGSKMAFNLLALMGLEAWRRVWAQSETQHKFVLHSTMCLALLGCFHIAFAALIMFTDSFALAEPEYRLKVACEQSLQTRFEKSQEAFTRAATEIRQCEDRKKALAVTINLSLHKGDIQESVANQLRQDIEATCDEHLALGKELLDATKELAAETCTPNKTASK